MSKFANQVVFVTGANRGIGKAFVDEVLKDGATKVYAAARKPEELKAVVAASEGKVIPVKLDVTNEADIDRVAAEYGDVTVLINNAGIAGFQGIIAAADTKAARAEMEVNYFGVLNLVRSFAPVLKKNGGGQIINVSSIAAHVNFPSIGSYSASKAAVHSLTQGIRAELSLQGTFVTGVYPGPVDTDMTAGVELDKTSPNVVARNVLDAVTAGEEDIYPDQMSSEVYAAYRGDPKAVERQFGEMLPQ